ncbi:MAG: TolC family protein, partial [Burkholderiales bacterium]|nr:TolC family protein [Burkholderiales bacterium]
SAAQAADAALRSGEITLPQAQRQARALLDQQLALQANAQQIAERTVALQLLTGSGIFATKG